MEQLSTCAEVFFTRLVMKADDYGAFHAHPKLILAALFPLKNYTTDQIEEWLRECVEVGLIRHYQVEGKNYIQIENFGQRLQNMRKAFPRPNATSPEVTVSHGESQGIPARNEEKRNELETKYIAPETFGTNAEAHKFLTTNHQDLSAAKTTLSNLGWSSVNDVDIGALAFHFCEKNLDVTTKPKDNARQHFQNWLNKIPIGDLQKIAVKTQAAHERRKRQSA